MKTIFTCMICILAIQLKGQIKLGNEVLAVGNKMATVKLYSAEKQPSGSLEYYILKKDSNILVTSEIHYDNKKNILYVYQYQLQLNSIHPDTMYFMVEENTMGSYLCSNFYAVDVLAEPGMQFICTSYTTMDTEVIKEEQTSSDYRFVFDTEKRANTWAAELNHYFKSTFRSNPTE